MKINKNTAHNSIELDFEGVKPTDECRKLLKSYGFWWFMKEKKWIHSLEIDAEFFENFVETRIKPLVSQPVNVEAAIAAMSDADKQALLAKLMGQ